VFGSLGLRSSARGMAITGLVTKLLLVYAPIFFVGLYYFVASFV
jgi:hypothetical protein